MLVSLVGSPASGKTTTAARVFASLKEEGFQTEMVMEAARRYIAHRRCDRGGPSIPILTDQDQVRIMETQLEAEEDFCYSGSKDLIVVTDASPLLALLYMSPECRDSEEVTDLLQRYRALAPTLFYAAPLPRRIGGDPNRIHTIEQSAAIDRDIPAVLQKYGAGLKVVSLVSSMEGRASQILEYVTS